VISPSLTTIRDGGLVLVGHVVGQWYSGKSPKRNPHKHEDRCVLVVQGTRQFHWYLEKKMCLTFDPITQGRFIQQHSTTTAKERFLHTFARLGIVRSYIRACGACGPLNGIQLRKRLPLLQLYLTWWWFQSTKTSTESSWIIQRGWYKTKK